ncbi:MAG: tripartite tricarboxylate transporter substrate binding protein [Betaproteobacteria bacterium]|nr:tripartite tricarboxylate transporter substrate binding protein [Betaproteobacteria bacterium]
MRFLATIAALLSAACVCASASAQGWPTKGVRIVVPYPPGGGIDILARQLAEKFAPQWDQPVVVENRPGGSTIPGTDAVAKAAPDGHTLLLSTDASFSINPHLFAKLPYDAQRDFIPVTMLILLQQLLVAHPALPANHLQELIALAKSKPGSLNYASYGSGSQPHLSGEMLKNRAGIDIVHVPYKGISLAVPAVMAGEVQLTFSGIASSIGPLKAGRLKAIAIGGPKRSALLPEVPTFTELGFPEVETHAWFGLFLPAGSPREAVARIYQDAKRVLEEPEFRQKQLIDRGYDVVGSSPEGFEAFLKTDSASRARAVKISGARAE